MKPDFLAFIATLALATLASQFPGARAEELPTLDDEAVTTYRDVTWEDFRGRRITFHGAQQARIATSIELERLEIDAEPSADGTWIARPTRVRAYALMHKLDSGYRPGGRSDWSLAHEQGHFDITEVLARRLRRATRELAAEGSSAAVAERELEVRIAALHDRLHAEWVETQERYDAETAHGTVKRQQKRWWKQLEEWLANTPR